MKKYELILTAKLLEMASDEFSNNGCNEMPKGIQKLLTKKQWTELDKEYHEFNGDPEEHDPKRPGIMNYDWIAMSFMKNKLLEEAEKLKD
jgi:hypothetical protein